MRQIQVSFYAIPKTKWTLRSVRAHSEDLTFITQTVSRNQSPEQGERSMPVELQHSNICQAINSWRRIRKPGSEPSEELRRSARTLDMADNSENSTIIGAEAAALPLAPCGRQTCTSLPRRAARRCPWKASKNHRARKKFIIHADLGCTNDAPVYVSLNINSNSLWQAGCSRL